MARWGLVALLLTSCHSVVSGSLGSSSVPDDDAPPGDTTTPLSDDVAPDDAAPTDDGDPVVIANSDPCRPFTMPSRDALFASSKRVFAHYFYQFQIYESVPPPASASDYYSTEWLVPVTTGVEAKWQPNGGFLRQRPLAAPVPNATAASDGVKWEVEMAMNAGITGFTIDILSANQGESGTQLANLLAAAEVVEPRFKIVVMLDLGAADVDDASAIEAIITRAAASSAAYRLSDGRVVVSSFAGEKEPASFWQGIIDNLATNGINVAFVPTFNGGNPADYSTVTYGYGDWGTATAAPAASIAANPAKAHTNGKIYMLPIETQQYRPKSFIYWEASNSTAFRNSWTSAITGGADWTQIVTWSDFSESGEIEPYTDLTLDGRIGTGFYDMNAYYAAWFLTGSAPDITEDALFFFYRREPVGAAAPNQSTPTTAVLAGGIAGTDLIEMVAFLTAPGTLAITAGGTTTTHDANAGTTTFTAPLAPGTPHFALQRNGTEGVQLRR